MSDIKDDLNTWIWRRAQGSTSGLLATGEAVLGAAGTLGSVWNIRPRPEVGDDLHGGLHFRWESPGRRCEVLVSADGDVICSHSTYVLGEWLKAAGLEPTSDRLLEMIDWVLEPTPTPTPTIPAGPKPCVAPMVDGVVGKLPWWMRPAVRGQLRRGAGFVDRQLPRVQIAREAIGRKLDECMRRLEGPDGKA